jgi:Ca2+-binding RTX toxin-like protein
VTTSGIYAAIHSASPSFWNATDAIVGGALLYLNHTGTSNVTYDLTSNTLSNVAIQAYGDNLTVKINSADAVGVTRFATAYANGLLVAADATLDLSHTQVSGFRVTSTNGLGTAFTVSDLGTAGQIAGGPGHDTIVAQGFTFTADQRNTIFAIASVEKIVDSGGTYLKDTTTADTFHGGSGNDTFNVDHVGDVVIEDANAGVDTIISTIHYRLPANVENLILEGSADLQGYGNSLGNFLYGNSGNNILNGDAGADVMVGGAGNDAYFVDHFADAVFENANEGTDTVYSTAHFRLSENVENLILQGSADLQGYGNGLANAIFGSSGNDLLDGGAGADWMSGGQGNDAYFVDNPGDLVTEQPGEGTDTVYASAHYRLGANVEHLVLQGSADLQGYGNDLANAIFGSSGNDLLDGSAGADWMSGGQGNDAYFVDNPGDLVTEQPGEGTDTVYASAHYRLGANVEYLVLQGTADLQGYGNDQSNAISGNSGSNVINGGGGSDMLTGGAGNDAFIFEKGQAQGDFVMDFSSGDMLAFVGYGVAAVFHQLDSTRWEVQYDGGASHEIINFMNSPTIHPSDFYFVI